MTASYTKTPVLESLLNSEYCEIFQSTYFEEHFQTAASENVFIKLFIKRINFTLKTPIFSTSVSESACFYFMINFISVKFVFIHILYFFGMVRNKLETLNMH